MTYAGVSPDYGGETGWWRVQDLAWYSFDALLMMIRIAGERTERSIGELCRELASARGISIGSERSRQEDPRGGW